MSFRIITGDDGGAMKEILERLHVKTIRLDITHPVEKWFRKGDLLDLDANDGTGKITHIVRNVTRHACEDDTLTVSTLVLTPTTKQQ